MSARLYKQIPGWSPRAIRARRWARSCSGVIAPLPEQTRDHVHEAAKLCQGQCPGEPDARASGSRIHRDRRDWDTGDQVPSPPLDGQWEGRSEGREGLGSPHVLGSEQPGSARSGSPHVLGSEQPGSAGSGSPHVLGSEQPGSVGSGSPHVLGSEQPASGSGSPQVLGSEQPGSAGSGSPQVLGSEQPGIRGRGSPHVLGSEQPGSSGSGSPHVLGSVHPCGLGSPHVLGSVQPELVTPASVVVTGTVGDSLHDVSTRAPMTSASLINARGRP